MKNCSPLVLPMFLNAVVLLLEIHSDFSLGTSLRFLLKFYQNFLEFFQKFPLKFKIRFHAEITPLENNPEELKWSRGLICESPKELFRESQYSFQLQINSENYFMDFITNSRRKSIRNSLKIFQCISEDVRVRFPVSAGTFQVGNSLHFCWHKVSS